MYNLITEYIPHTPELESSLMYFCEEFYSVPQIIVLPREPVHYYIQSNESIPPLTHTKIGINWDEWFIYYYIYYYSLLRDVDLIEHFPSILGMLFTPKILEIEKTPTHITSCIHPQMMCAFKGNFEYQFIWYNVNATFNIVDGTIIESLTIQSPKSKWIPPKKKGKK